MSIHKLLGVADEEPLDPKTWSGSSRFFFNALKEQGYLHDAISAQPPKPLQWLYKALSFHPKIGKWKFKYHLNTGYYSCMTQTAKRKLELLDSTQFDTIVQIGAWLDMTGIQGKNVVSYHDGNLARLIASPYGYPQIKDSYISRTLRYERELYSRVNLIFTMSKWLAKSFCRDFAVADNKVFPIGAGINLSRVREIRNKSYDVPRLLFVGKNFDRKGGDVLLEAFQIVRQEIKEAELTIIGPMLESSPEGVHCKGFISKLTDDGLDKLLDEYEHASAFVLPSLYEPFGVVFIEAMAHRLPCIGSNICAMPEIIQHGKTGYVVPPNDPKSLADHLLLLLKNPGRCKEFGNAGYEHYMQNFTWKTVASRMCAIIDRELGFS
jgi:glycosyltransferase involved in cell wall biosynthesis